MAFVLLPCDLPTWAKIERMLRPLLEDCSDAQLVMTLHALHSLCNISIDPEGLNSVPTNYFEPLQKFITEDPQLQKILKPAVQRLVQSAIDLKNLKPPEGLCYSLQQQNDALVLPRPIVASLLAHTVLSTLPRRSTMSHPTLSDPVLAPVLNALDSEDERVKVRAILQYFALLASDEKRMSGRVIIDRKVMSAENFLRLRKWRDSTKRLCRLQAISERPAKIPSRPTILACCCTAHPARATLLPHSIHDAKSLDDHPELLITGLLVEKMEDNEAIQMTGVLSTSQPKAPSPDDITYALIDPDDYCDNWILQYEQINLLRELNKCYLAFSPPITHVLKQIPTIPSGIPLKRHLSSGVSGCSVTLSAEESESSTPFARSIDSQDWQTSQKSSQDKGKDQEISDLDILDLLNKQSENEDEKKQGLSDLDILDLLNKQSAIRSEDTEKKEDKSDLNLIGLLKRRMSTKSNTSTGKEGLSDLDILDMLNRRSSVKSNNSEKQGLSDLDVLDMLNRRSSVKSNNSEKQGLSDLDVLDMLNRQSSVKSNSSEKRQGLSDLDVLDMLNRQSSVKSNSSDKNKGLSDLDILDMLNRRASIKSNSSQKNPGLSDLDILDMLNRQASVKSSSSDKKEGLSDLDILDMLNRQSSVKSNSSEKREGLSDLDILDMLNRQSSIKSNSSEKNKGLSDLDILDMLNRQASVKSNSSEKDQGLSDLDILDMLNRRASVKSNNSEKNQGLSDLDILDMLNRRASVKSSSSEKNQGLSDLDILDMLNRQSSVKSNSSEKKEGLSNLDILDMLNRQSSVKSNPSDKNQELSDLEILDSLNRQSSLKSSDTEGRQVISDLKILNMLRQKSNSAEDSLTNEGQTNLEILYELKRKLSEKASKDEIKEATHLEQNESLNDNNNEPGDSTKVGAKSGTLSDSNNSHSFQDAGEGTTGGGLSDWDILNMMNKENDDIPTECSSKPDSGIRSKPSASPESEKRKIPKLLEKILPKRILSSGKKKSDGSDTKTDHSSGVYTDESEKSFTKSKVSTKEGTSSKAGTSDFKKTEEKPGCRFLQDPNKKCTNDCSAIPPTPDTSDLLNRVVQAIQKLESEQSNSTRKENKNLLGGDPKTKGSEDRNPKSISRILSKPPLPETRRKGETSSQVPTSNISSKLPVNQNSGEEEQFFSACESLDAGDERPRRKGGRRERISKCRRKHSFAERLKEAMERGISSDRGSQTSETKDCSKDVKRKNSDGFVLGMDESCPSEASKACRMDEPRVTDGSKIVMKVCVKAKGEVSANGNEDEIDENMDQEDDDKSGSGSSRYSFSSDYTSELDEVYDHLEEVLQELEGATPGPRTAAIAQLAHSLLKRAFSESSKGLGVGLDGCVTDKELPSRIGVASGTVDTIPETVNDETAEGTSSSCAKIRSLSLTGASAMVGGENLRGSIGEESKEYEGMIQVPSTEGATVITESWGCEELGGNRQLKAMIQWAACSMAGAECVIYNTAGHKDLVKLSVVSRLLSDRGWTVGRLIQALLRHSHSTVTKWKAIKNKQPKKDVGMDAFGGTALFDRLLSPAEASAVARSNK